jgi:hypothetical protein
VRARTVCLTSRRVTIRVRNKHISSILWNVDPPVFGQCPDGGNQRIRTGSAVLSHNEIALSSLA